MVLTKDEAQDLLSMVKSVVSLSPADIRDILRNEPLGEELTKRMRASPEYAEAIKETVEYANEVLKQNGVPLTFGLPPDKLIEVDMFNFDQYE